MEETMNSTAKSVGTVVIGLLLLSTQAQAAEQKTVLMLVGKFCESYRKEIYEALTAVKGVKSVDLKRMEGHAIVNHDETVNPMVLVTAMNGVKDTKAGAEWTCTAEAIK
jgi:copper chaperone CopZ